MGDRHFACGFDHRCCRSSHRAHVEQTDTMGVQAPRRACALAARTSPDRVFVPIAFGVRFNMKKRLSVGASWPCAFGLLALAGCAADVDGSVEGASVSGLGQQVTAEPEQRPFSLLGWLLPDPVFDTVSSVEDCTAELAECVVGFEVPSEAVECNEDYVQCVAGSLDVPVPDLPLADTVACAEDAAECTLGSSSVREIAGCGAVLTSCTVGNVVDVVGTVDELLSCDGVLSCTIESELPSDAVACVEDEAECLADTFGVPLPELPASELTHCVEHAFECVTYAESTGDLAGCAAEFTGCTGESIEVIGAVDDVLQCTTETSECVFSAERPSEVSACAEEEVACVFGSLDVELPDLPVEEATVCAEDAIECTLGARSISDVTECATELTSCAADAVVAPLVNCDAVFTQCLAANPLDLFGCAARRLSCDSGLE